MYLPWILLALFIVALGFSYAINGLLLKFSRSLGSRHDQQRHIIRWASTVKPSLGGFSFYIVFLLSVSVVGFLNNGQSSFFNLAALGVLLAVNLGFLLGLSDDAYDTIPVLKFFVQLFCGAILVATGLIIPATGNFSVDCFLTLFWVVGIMNSINMLDNMDGISGIVSFFILATVLIVLGMEGSLNSVTAIVTMGVCGSLIGFLFHNRFPARIYMGDTGSQFLGALLAAVSIQTLWKYHEPVGNVIQLKQCLIPLVAFTVPILDTSTVIIHRIARGQSPFVGGRDHITHHLVYAGLTEKQVMWTLGSWSALSMVLTALLVYYYHQLTLTAVIGGYTYLLVSFLITQYLYEVGKRKEMKYISGKSVKTASIQAPQSVPA
jgi:UDP-GlcNAc:undecaprenyl-phosphate GlcNAc-1-phosphate transferase